MGIGPDVKDNFPEVEEYVRLTRDNALFSYGDVFFKEDGVYYATETFFKVFSVPLIEGVDSTVLKGPFKVVLSESMAKKYFGEENPIGKTIRNNGETDYEVTGVFKDLPANTHMNISALFSYSSFESLVNNPEAMRSWHWDGHFTYILLDEHADPQVFEQKLAKFSEEHEAEELKRAGAGMVFHLQQLTATGNQRISFPS
jgi:putative ABC transport system permease protein